MRILGLFLILVLGLATPLAFSENIVDVIKNENKFQFFEKPLLDLIESGEVTKYQVKILASSKDITTQQDEIELITSLITSRYDATEITHDKNLLGNYVQATIPVENLLLIVKLDFVGAILASNSPFVDDQTNLSIGEQIKYNPKFIGFFDHLLDSIDEKKVDIVKVGVAVVQYSFQNISGEYLKQKVEKLATALQDNPNITELNIDTYGATFSILVEDLPQIGQYDFVETISFKGGAFDELAPDKSSGIFKMPLYEHLYDIPFVVNDATFASVDERGINVNAKPRGNLLIDLPREIIDSRDIFGKLSFYDNNAGLVLESHPDLFVMEDKEINCNSRQLLFTFPEGFNGRTFWDIESYEQQPGALLYPWFPPFDRINLPYLGPLTNDKFTIETKNKKFEIETIQGGAICSLDFESEEKKITISARGLIQVTSPQNDVIIPSSFDVIIPNTLLSGDFTVLSEGQEVSFTMKKTMTENILTVTHSFEKNPTVFEIIGSTVFSQPFQLPTESGIEFPVDNTTYSIKYASSNDIKIKSITAYHADGFSSTDYGFYVKRHILFNVDAVESGTITITLPEKLISKDKGSIGDHVFTIDGIQINPIDSIFASDSKTVTMQIPAGTKQISR